MSVADDAPQPGGINSPPADLPDDSIGPVGSSGNKEQEPTQAQREEEAAMISEIKSVSEAQDKEALEKVLSTVPEAKAAVFDPELSPEVKEMGVVNPTEEANDVVRQGSTLNLNFSENEYQEGKKTKVVGSVSDKSIIGVSSLAALGIMIGRLIKMAHKHAMKIVFRSSVAKASEDKKE